MLTSFIIQVAQARAANVITQSIQIEFEILEIRVTGTNFYIYCGNKTTGETVYFDGEDIGDEWFTTEEACDLHRRAFGLDKPKNESDEVRLAELKGE